MTEDILVRLRQALPGLRPSERRLAEAALADPGVAAALTITELAARHETSTATVTRLCRNLGFAGYSAFRLALARAGANESGRRVEFGVSEGDIDPADTTRDVVRKLAYQEARAVEETADRLDLDQLDRVVAAITNASVVDAYGSASSGLAAQDLQQKLRRIGYQVNAWADAHLALTSAAVLPPDAVAVAFSHSGETEEAISALRIAAGRGAFTVAVTNFPRSPLAEVADATLTTVARETRFRYGAMSSRMAQLMIVDAIFLAVAHENPDDVTAALGATLDAVASRRVNRSRA
ncbi:MurR/RpiR family transcriptional regulator [Nocardioides sp. KC13]|uniref:MurR/RpiR family transcriptional regulator n=1 Tax=Nocardioides turkmenicus TaxID=2711220 RepID=A0A6M1RB02_9ACTN|nr:MurR/RpiR family transcriptional regulator [Nocardioides sp. KC13]NGN94808.1 MurR/RpiR family transcriptional regulator [Nocardioides sp. KC13]